MSDETPRRATQREATPREATPREATPRDQAPRARTIDEHDVRAYCARARQAIDEAEARAVPAARPGWILGRRERADHARAFLAKARRALEELEASLDLTLDRGEAAQEAENEALLGADELVPADE
ncbi:MAG: hypothetical protein CMN31_02865 [Sandaracinus sp.]|nr:hypothetical protein [Sandaracinus sp.]